MKKEYGRQELDERDVVFRGIAFLMIAALIWAVVLLLVLDARSRIGKDSSFTDWALVTLTFAYVVVSVLLWLSVQSQVKLARDTAQRQLRAYVGVETGSVAAIGLGVFRASITVKNAGLTPAHNVRHFGELILGSLPEPSTLPEMDESQGASAYVLLPGGEMYAGATSDVLTTEDWSRIGSKQATLYAYGTILYIDAFQQKRVSTYRMMMAPDDVRTTNRGETLTVCAEGNTMT